MISEGASYKLNAIQRESVIAAQLQTWISDVPNGEQVMKILDTESRLERWLGDCSDMPDNSVNYRSGNIRDEFGNVSAGVGSV